MTAAADPPFDLVVFDCDGVLIDIERIAVRVDAEVLRRLGWPLTEAEIVDRFVGRSHAHMVAEIERHLGRTLAPDWEDAFQPLYDAAYEAELGPVDGVEDALDRITLPTCVASNSSRARLAYTLRLAGLHDRFAGRVFSTEDVGKDKPAPDVFLHAAATMGAEPRRCAVVEDSPAGIAAGRAAGMQVFAYGGGLTPPHRLAGPATTVFTDMRALPGLLAGSGGARD